MDRGAWLATVYKVAKSQTRLSACAHAHIDTLLVKIGVVSYLELLWVKDGEGNGTPLQYSCLENPMDGGAC